MESGWVVDYAIERVFTWKVETYDSNKKVLKNSRHHIFERWKVSNFVNWKNKILVDWDRDENKTKKENGSHSANRFYEGKKKKVICNGNGVFLTFILYHKLWKKSTEKIEKLHIF